METQQQIFQSMREQDPENNLCFDCGVVSPQWASLNNGVFVCLNCAGVHRGLGVQTSFIRSLTLDSWTMAQLQQMRAGGNSKLKEYLANYGLSDETIH
mmetsp:Transcript_11163/g.18751  ORF Transcript_11163/g.18751 Transcript_11163/m.18751 type:complete len:98 (-) Transcript_11163:721-1014(-)